MWFVGVVYSTKLVVDRLVWASAEQGEHRSVMVYTGRQHVLLGFARKRMSGYVVARLPGYVFSQGAADVECVADAGRVAVVGDHIVGIVAGYARLVLEVFLEVFAMKIYWRY